jgi:hypothetical protein
MSVILWMQRNAYEESTIKKKVAKRLRHIQRTCDVANPEAVRLYISRKKSGNGNKETLNEAYAIFIRSAGKTWNQPF